MTGIIALSKGTKIEYKWQYSHDKKEELELLSIKNIPNTPHGFFFYADINDFSPIKDADYYEVKASKFIIHYSNYAGKIKEGDIWLTSCLEIIKKLSTEDLISLDKTGKWSYEYALLHNLSSILIENNIVDKDITGEWSYNYAINVEASSKLINNIIEKDNCGKWSYLTLNKLHKMLTMNIKEALLSNIDSFDNSGEYYYQLALDDIFDIDFQKDIENRDETGKYCYLYAKNVKGSEIVSLQERVVHLAIYNADEKYCTKFLKHIEGADETRLIRVIKQIKNLREEAKKEYAEYFY